MYFFKNLNLELTHDYQNGLKCLFAKGRKNMLDDESKQNKPSLYEESGTVNSLSPWLSMSKLH